MNTEKALSVCIVCDLLWSIAMFAGAAYLVFFKGANIIAFLWAFVLCMCWSCRRYAPGYKEDAE